MRAGGVDRQGCGKQLDVAAAPCSAHGQGAWLWRGAVLARRWLWLCQLWQC